MWRTLVGLMIALDLFPFFMPCAAKAQQMGKVPRIGIFQTSESPAPIWEDFRPGLRDLGYVEGQNLVIKFRNLKTAEGLGLTIPPTLLILADKVIK